MFVLSFINGNDGQAKDSFDRYYMLLIEVNAFNVLIENKRFLDEPVISKQKPYEKLVQMSRNNDYTTRKSLAYL